MGKITLRQEIHRFQNIGKIVINELSKDIELDNQVIDPETAYLILAEKFGIDCNKNKAVDILTYLGEKNSYHPVREYLKNLANKGCQEISLDHLAQQYFGLTDSIYQIYLKKWLISCVARVMHPGCKVDTALVLQGDQGIGKSSFFRVIGGNWFDDSMGDLTNYKDDCLCLHRCWIQEWGELDRIFSKSQDASVKHFLAKKDDLIRPPYARSHKKFLRTSVVVGSTNKQEFLKDETGSRRFWIIPVKSINLDQLESDRDNLLFSAFLAYNRKESYWLTSEEEALREKANYQFQESDSWKTAIFDYLIGKSETTTEDILETCLKFDLNKITRADQARVTNIIVALGWIKGNRKRYKGKQTRVWVKDNLANII